MVNITKWLSPVTGSVWQTRNKCLCTPGMTSSVVGRRRGCQGKKGVFAPGPAVRVWSRGNWVYSPSPKNHPGMGQCLRNLAAPFPQESSVPVARILIPLPHQCLLSRSRTRKPSWPLGHLWEEWVHEPGPHLELASCAGLARFYMFVSQPSAQL